MSVYSSSATLSLFVAVTSSVLDELAQPQINSDESNTAPIFFISIASLWLQYDNSIRGKNIRNLTAHGIIYCFYLFFIDK
jgi:hypothetical protein